MFATINVFWAKIGGESHPRGMTPRPCALERLRNLRDYFQGQAAVFIKRVGGRPTESGALLRLQDKNMAAIGMIGRGSARS